MGGLQPTHWIIIAVVVLVLFGSKKLPDAARGLGRSMRIFKSEIQEMRDEDKDKAPNGVAAPGVIAPTPVTPAAPQTVVPPAAEQQPGTGAH